MNHTNDLPSDYDVFLNTIKQTLVKIEKDYGTCKKNGIINKLTKNPKIYIEWIEEIKSRFSYNPVEIKLFISQLAEMIKDLDKRKSFKKINIQQEIEHLKEKNGDDAYLILAHCIYRIYEMGKGSLKHPDKVAIGIYVKPDRYLTS